MSNLLPVPFKRPSPVDIRDPVRNYILFHAGVHPDEFKPDITRWQALRNDAVASAVHVNSVDPILLSVSRCTHHFP